MKKDFEAFGPLHPGEILAEEYLKPLGISQNKLAINMRVPAQRISEIVNGKRSITADTALRLSKVIGTTPEFWMSLQAYYDLQVEKRAKGDQISREVIPMGSTFFC